MHSNLHFKSPMYQCTLHDGWFYDDYDQGSPGIEQRWGKGSAHPSWSTPQLHTSTANHSHPKTLGCRKGRTEDELSTHVGSPTAEVGDASISLNGQTTPISTLGISYVPTILEDDDSRSCPETDQLWGKGASHASLSTPHCQHSFSQLSRTKLLVRYKSSS